MLAGVVGAAVRRVVAVVGHKQQPIPLLHRAEQFGEPFVEVCKCARVALGVTAVAVERIELD